MIVAAKFIRFSASVFSAGSPGWNRIFPAFSTPIGAVTTTRFAWNTPRFVPTVTPFASYVMSFTTVLRRMSSSRANIRGTSSNPFANSRSAGPTKFASNPYSYSEILSSSAPAPSLNSVFIGVFIPKISSGVNGGSRVASTSSYASCTPVSGNPPPSRSAA